MIATITASIPITIPTISPVPIVRISSTAVALAEGDGVDEAVWVNLDRVAASDERLGPDDISDGRLDILEEIDGFSSPSDVVVDGDTD